MRLYLIAILCVFGGFPPSAKPFGSMIMRALPNVESAETARTLLAQLTVLPESNSPPYVRTRFKHWHTISGSCDTRETVLQRDGIDVKADPRSCRAISGTWVSPYDNLTFTDADRLDIDHLVPLREAWVSGARLWNDTLREAFANDLTRPQLIAVTDVLNQAKGDKDPGEWMPPLASYRCTYVQAWVIVKRYYNLTVDMVEKAALEGYLKPC